MGGPVDPFLAASTRHALTRALTTALQVEDYAQEVRDREFLDTTDRDILRVVLGEGKVTAYGRKRLARLIAYGFVQARGSSWQRKPLELTTSGEIALQLLEQFLKGHEDRIQIGEITGRPR